MKYINMFKCSNCPNIRDIEVAHYCIICGMMICGDCGNFCKNHNSKTLDKLVIFAVGDMILGTRQAYSSEIVKEFCFANNCELLDTLEFEAFVWIEVK